MAAKAPSRKRGKPRKPPADLQDVGKASWALLWQLPQIAWPDDEPLVARLCRVYDEAASLRDALLEQGRVLLKPIQNARGEQLGTEPVVHPALLALRRLGAEEGELCNALGIGANARHTLGLTVAERPVDFVDELKAHHAIRRARMGYRRRKASGA